MSKLKVVETDVDNHDEETTKEQYVISYLKSMISIEQAIEPFKEQKKELRKEYIDNNWLTREDLWATVRAFRLYEQSADIDDLNDMFEIVEQQFGRKE